MPNTNQYPVVYDAFVGLAYLFDSITIPIVTGGGGSPGGSSTQIQYNDTGAFAGSPLLTFQTVASVIPFLSLNSDSEAVIGFSSADGLVQYGTIANFGTTVLGLSHPNFIELAAGGVQVNVLQPGKVVVSTEPSAGDPSAIFEVRSTTKGTLLSTMTEAQRDAIATPAEGLEIYNLDTHTKNFWNGTVWKAVATV